jgi:glycosyltransferase involved in cell wall biosynthesis/thymidylate kinase
MTLLLAEPELARAHLVVCFGFEADRIRRQPWHVAHGLALGLSRLGHRVRLVTDAGDPPAGQPYEIVRVGALTRHGRITPATRAAVAEAGPERVFMIVGGMALVRLAPLDFPAPTFLVFASPRLRLREILRLGPRALWRERRLLALPLLGALLPGPLLVRGFRRSGAAELVYLSRATQARCAALGLPAGLRLVPQVAPEAVFRPGPANTADSVTYLGPPLDLRGAWLALEAFEQATAQGLYARLRMLFRPDAGPHSLAALIRRIEASPCRERITFETVMLDPATLQERVAGTRVFLLPFKITVSEVPLVVIEAGLSGRPVVTLDAPGVSEYVEALGGIVARSPAALPDALREAFARPAARRPDAAAWTRWDRAVLPLLEPRRRRLDAWRLIALAGVDGSGKSFLLERLRERLAAQGIAHRHVWSRFRNYLSKPLLALARLTGHNRKERIGSVRIGYHDFAGGRLLAGTFLVLQSIDNILDILLRYRLQPSRGVIVGDRCVYDTLVDLCVDTGRDGLVLERIGPWLVRLLPAPRLVVVLDRSPRLIQAQRPDALLDRHFARRRALYRRLADRYGLPVLSNDGDVEDTLAQLVRLAEGAEA